MTLRDFVPPVAFSVARRLVPRPRRKRYGTYEEALADCPENGYANADIVQVVLEKTKPYRDRVFRTEAPLQLSATSAYSLCSLLGSVESQEINVIDFGGACGAHYFLARALLPSSCKLNWIVVETPAMARRAGAVLATDELGFSSDLSAAAASLKRVDLIHTSGTLQYIDKPYDCLRALVSVSASQILFNRLGLTRGQQDVITVQEAWLSGNGPGPMPRGIPDRKLRFPCIFPKESEFYDAIGETYDVVMKFDDPSGIFPVDDEPIIGVGLLARRKRSIGSLQHGPAARGRAA